jgi:hypothetical protein
MHALRLAFVTLTIGLLCAHLGREVVVGLRTGSIRYAGGFKCKRAERPTLFWSLVALFSMFIAISAFVLVTIVLPQALAP